MPGGLDIHFAVPEVGKPKDVIDAQVMLDRVLSAHADAYAALGTAQNELARAVEEDEQARALALVEGVEAPEPKGRGQEGRTVAGHRTF